MGFEPTFSCLEGKGTTFIPTPQLVLDEGNDPSRFR